MSMTTADLEKAETKKIALKEVMRDGVRFFKISNYDQMRPFFMSIVSDANHWMFISSNGGLTAGRKNPESSLFPYYTEDKLTDFADITGSKMILQVTVNEQISFWEPFSDRFSDRYRLSRNIYKSIYGNQVLFEEVNHDLGLTISYKWAFSNQFGFVKETQLTNEESDPRKVKVLDGIQNIVPYGVPSDLQRSTSNLVDAYKRNEKDELTDIGIFSLSAIIVDKAEPSEALKANIAWSTGQKNPVILLSSKQLAAFRRGGSILPEHDIKGEKGAYFTIQDLQLAPNSAASWHIIAEVNQSYAQVVQLRNKLIRSKDIQKEIQEDIAVGTQRLISFVNAADGIQKTSDSLNDARHYSNVLFNIMRGGIFDDQYTLEKEDLLQYLKNGNKEIIARNKAFIDALPKQINVSELQSHLSKSEDADLIRLCTEYLPLKFSRRHGDPSRPWNSFTINSQGDKGGKVLDYEGNWRDLFQNWEALACSYPDYLSGMIFKFLNSSTFDGYNPYRITRAGFDWETIEPDNPWSYIGYWGDHQIIYLLKFFEIIEKAYPNTLKSWFDKQWFVYAAVPYRIKAYDKIVENPKDTIDFDEHWDKLLRERRDQLGADGTLLVSNEGGVYHVNFIEKILATLLAKISNLVPEAGIWMNTQRPEWNDANNALVGNGASMVTTYYLFRFLQFFKKQLDSCEAENFKVSGELIEFYHSVRQTMLDFSPLLSDAFKPEDRKRFVDQLGKAASEYRSQIYEHGFWGKKRTISLEGLKTFTQLSLDFVEHSILANQRPDKLFHAYNLISVDDKSIEISYLSEMLEGQVGILSSGYLSSEEAMEVLNALKQSALFRPDQYSYVLYPNKSLPGFFKKNVIPKSLIQSSELLQTLVNHGDVSIVEKDENGDFHFNGAFTNAGDVKVALDKLSLTEHGALVEKGRGGVLDIFEKVFNHKAFTGRSGTFFSYEGLGSIYWHMVSKLHLSVQECCVKAIEEKADPVVIGQLLDHYYEIEAGIGVHKSPELYGAFPTDPYSHTPLHRGAQQPGMTGQVKEDILVRWGELGVFFHNGHLIFNPCLLRNEEFLNEPASITLIDLMGQPITVELQANSLGFSYCQVPVIYHQATKELIRINYRDGRAKELKSLMMDVADSMHVFKRTGQIESVDVYIPREILK